MAEAYQAHAPGQRSGRRCAACFLRLEAQPARSTGYFNDTLPDHAELEVYSDDYLAAKPVVQLPCIEPFDTQFPNGRFVFAASNGQQVYVLAQTKVAASSSWVLAVSTRE